MKKWLSLFLLFLVGISAEESFISLGDAGGIHYIHEENCLLKIERISPFGEVMYAHTYLYDENGAFLAEDLIGNLGKVEYHKDISVRSPYHYEERTYDDRHNVIKQVIDGVSYEYAYNDLDELITDEVDLDP